MSAELFVNRSRSHASQRHLTYRSQDFPSARVASLGTCIANGSVMRAVFDDVLPLATLLRFEFLFDRCVEGSIMNNQPLRQLIARPVVSRESGDNLGRVHDLLVDTSNGTLKGFAVTRYDGSCALTDFRDVVAVGAEILVKRDESLVWAEASPLNSILRARRDLVGRKVTTAEGRMLGRLADVVVCGTGDRFIIYKAYHSIWARLNGEAFYFTGGLLPKPAVRTQVLTVAGDSVELHRRLEAAVA